MLGCIVGCMLPASPLFLVCGDESVLVRAAVGRWRTECGALGLDLELLDHPASLGALTTALTEGSLFAEERALLVKDFTYLLEKGNKGAASLEQLVRALHGRPEELAVCFSASLLPESHPLVKAVRELGGKVERCEKMKGRALTAWAEQLLRGASFTPTPQARAELLGLASEGAELFSNEVAKLESLFAGQSVGVDEIRRYVSLEGGAEAWQLLDDLCRSPGDAMGRMELLLSRGNAPVQLLGSLALQVHDLLAVASAIASSPPGGAAQLGMPPWKFEQVSRLSRKVGLNRAQRWLALLHYADLASKRGDAEPQAALQLALAQMAQSLGA